MTVGNDRNEAARRAEGTIFRNNGYRYRNVPKTVRL